MATTNTPARFGYARYATIRDTRNFPPLTVATDEHGTVLPWGGAADFKSGSNNPGWRDKITRHVDASSAYSRHVFQEYTPGVTVGRTRTKATGVTAGYQVEGFARDEGTNGTIAFVSLADSSLQNTALSRLKDKLRSQTSAANVMAPIAELGELHRTIVQLATFTSDTLESLLELRKGRTRRVNKLWKNTWLNWNFGIKPLISDVNSAGQAIASFLSRQDLTYPIHGSAKRDGMFSYAPNFASNVAPIGATADGIGGAAYKLSYRYTGAFNSKMRSANDYSAFNHLGVDLEHIPYTLWELTGFSWMADYFSNIGNYLEDRFYCPPGNLVFLNLTRKYEVTFNNFMTYKVIPGNPNNIDMIYVHPSVSTIKYKEVDRSVLGTLPHVALDFYRVDRIGQAAVTKLLNLVAVMRKR
jgi:hypothetical protein